MPTCTDRFLPSTDREALPLTYQPKEPVEKLRGSATIGKPPMSIFSGSALARKSSREIGHTVFGGIPIGYRGAAEKGRSLALGIGWGEVCRRCARCYAVMTGRRVGRFGRREGATSSST